MKKTVLLFLLGILINNKAYTQCFSKIDAGDYSNLAIKTDGSLWAWGANFEGQLGNGTNGYGSAYNKTEPIQIGSDTNWQSVSAGGMHSLAIKTDRTLWAWGDNNAGQLGIGTSGSTDRNVPTQVGTASDWNSISAGDSYSLAIKNDGTLWAWGSNSNGKLGNGSPYINSLVPIQIGTASNWQSVKAGYDFSLAIKNDGTLWGWGNNSSGQLGNGTTADSSVPIQIGTDTDWVKVSSGIPHSMAIKSNGTLWAWGSNFPGQFGNGTTVDSFVPIQIGSDTNWQNVDVAGFTSMAMKNDGTLWGSGNNGNGQLGTGNTQVINTFTQIPSASWLSVTTADSRTIAIQSNGNLFSWGFDGYGALGNGPIITSNVLSPGMINNCNDLSASDFDTMNTTVYPNPTDNNIEVDSNNLITRIEIYDLNGRLITSKNENSLTVSLNLESFKTGIYFLKIISEKGNSFQKIVKN